jgi:hypothetical protein
VERNQLLIQLLEQRPVVAQIGVVGDDFGRSGDELAQEKIHSGPLLTLVHVELEASDLGQLAAQIDQSLEKEDALTVVVSI